MRIKRLDKNFTLLDANADLIAHMGIHGYSKKLNKRIKPNSFEAVKLAIDNNIPFEIDIRNTADHIAILEHDNIIKLDAERVKINHLTYSQLKEKMGDDMPCTLEEVLEYNNGKVPIVIDAKEANIFYSKYRRNLSELLNKFSMNTELILQSFNPFFILSMRKKGFATGQLICRGETFLSVFKGPKTFANVYEKIVSFVCFISDADMIVMENHSNKKWNKRTSIFTSEEAYENKKKKLESLQEKLDNAIYKGRRKLLKIADKIQLKLVKAAHDLTKKPVLAFTIENELEFGEIDSFYITNYIVDFGIRGIDNYIDDIKKLSQERKNQCNH